ncbi:hypothetical protein C7S18_11290 [Ahniella affigens]|uniref:Peptidase S74 domain-containing protein n=1 Tax=Ahniella affigens TaxID=2021234 RepID=A0A2P1PSB4_9GAMM|nr:tail fiber domain-containing protein [Ahniella affigens]AVP97746.1 hypothetical protein C7S18_11290 [Ahniella affigens]
MRLSCHRLALGITLALASVGVSANAFTYRGQLSDQGQPANGRYDLRLTLHADAVSGKALASPMTFEDVVVSNGSFTLSFEGPSAISAELWVGVEVRDNDLAAFEATPGRSKALLGNTIGQCWSTTGDSGSNPATHFLGTIDAQPLVLKTANVQSLRIEPSGEVFGAPAVPITANMIGGSSANVVSPGVRGAVIAGGGVPTGTSDPQYANEAPNIVSDHYGTVSGGYGNTVGDNDDTLSESPFAAIGGGLANEATGSAAVVPGGYLNRAVGYVSAIGGGESNFASGSGSAISGGASNIATGYRASVGGGTLNESLGAYSVVAGGINNVARANSSAIAGGEVNTAMGLYSFVSGGFGNCAGATRSFAGGNRAKVRPPTGNDQDSCAFVPTTPGGDSGSFAWADSQSSDFVTSGSDQFIVRAQGGVGINAAPVVPNVEMMIQANATGSETSNIWLKQRSTNRGILFSAGDGTGANDSGFYIDHYNGGPPVRRMSLANDGSVFIRSNTTGANSGVAMAPGDGAFTSLSDRHAKTAIEPVDARSILERVVQMPISSWQYKAQPGDVRHIGPMAQDFMAAFSVGSTDKGINTIDADGEALAAIQGLNEKLAAENAALVSEQQLLRQELESIRSRLDDLVEAAGHE